jgi:hypothetical protein
VSLQVAGIPDAILLFDPLLCDKADGGEPHSPPAGKALRHTAPRECPGLGIEGRRRARIMLMKYRWTAEASYPPGDLLVGRG